MQISSRTTITQTNTSRFSYLPDTNQRRRRGGQNQSNIYQQLINLLIRLIKQLQNSDSHKKTTPYRTFDGTENNPRYPKLGSADQPFRQLIKKDNDREIGGATEARLPSARAVSNAVADQQSSTTNNKGLSDMFWLWGQFLDHDINLTLENPNSSANIPVPEGDSLFDPEGTGKAEIIFHHSATATDPSGEQTQFNDITAYIDGSNIYGSNKETADGLRSFSGGRLIESAGGLLPVDDRGLFVSGDIRTNENVGLSSMHTLWMREHNRVADTLSTKHPEWSDEKLFQESRKQVIAQMQAITYNEFVPQLLGQDKIGDYQGYNSRLSPQISNSFSTAAYRLGHTMLSSNLLRLDEQGNEIPEGNLALREAFFNPDRVREAGIDPILRGFSAQTAQAIDPMLVDDVRNFLFGKPGEGGFDLAALNTQRGRDHGLASLNDSREALGLSRITSFDDPTWQGDFGQKLAQVYDHPDDVDLWIGGLAEKQEGNSLVGATFTEILTDQFKRLRSADRYWYEKQFSQSDINNFNNTTLADVIKRNTDIESLQDNVMVAQPRGQFAVQAATVRSAATAADGQLAAPTPAATATSAQTAPTLDPQQEQRIREALANGLFG